MRCCDWHLCMQALDTLHERCLPKMGYGCENGNKYMPGCQPVRVAWEHGARLFDIEDPSWTAFLGEGVCPDKWAEELRGLDLSDSVISSYPCTWTMEEEDCATSMRDIVRRSFDALATALGAHPASSLLPCV